MFFWKRKSSLEETVNTKLQELIQLAEKTPDVWNNWNIVEVQFDNPLRSINAGKVIFRIGGVTGKSLTSREIATRRFVELFLEAREGKDKATISSLLSAFSGTYNEVIAQLKEPGVSDLLVRKIKEKARKL